jgi:hypothetical protein
MCVIVIRPMLRHINELFGYNAKSFSRVSDRHIFISNWYTKQFRDFHRNKINWTEFSKIGFEKQFFSSRKEGNKGKI